MNEKWIKAFKVFCFEVFFLISFGAAVRAMNAGLACPDWPLCFGQFIPDYHPEVYFEFIHRVLAGTVAIFMVLFAWRIFKDKELGTGVKRVTVLALCLLFGQVIMGGLTVLLQLHEKTVTTHLAMGTLFFACCIWIYKSIKHERTSTVRSSIIQTIPKQTNPARKFTLFVWVAIFVQIILGGLVASYYAGTACSDFPLCNGQFIPSLKGIVGLQVIHRLGAYTLSAIILTYAVYVFRNIKDQSFRSTTLYLVSLLLIQICVGIANVLFYTPPLITVFHLTVATAMLGIITAQTYEVT